MRWPWRSRKPASQPEEEQEPAVGHRNLHIEHGDVETESTASEHWPGLPVEEEVPVEDPAGDQTSSADDVEAMAATPPEHAPRVMEEEKETSSDSDGEDVESSSEGMRARRLRRRSPRRRRRRSRGGLPVCVAVAVMLLAIVALVASRKRRQRRRGRPAAGAG